MSTSQTALQIQDKNSDLSTQSEPIMNISNISTSTCFTGASSNEADELRKRRDTLAGRATDAIALFEALKPFPPSIDNADGRGDFDETVACIVKEFNEWIADAEAFAVTFGDPETRKKMVKRLSNYTR